MQKVIFLLLLKASLTSSPGFAESKKIVKWVDNSGVTHYGDKLPAQEAGRNNTEMSARGIVTKRNILLDKKDDSVEQEKDRQKLDQARKDNVLLASYTNASEIDLALERNLQMDQAFIQSLTQQQLNVFNRIAHFKATTQHLKVNKNSIPPYLTDDLTLAQLESIKLKQMIIEKKMAMEALRTHYTQVKARFIKLKLPLLSESLVPATASPIATSTNQPLSKIKDSAL